MSDFDQVKEILGHALQIPERAAEFTESTELLGSVAELDSMAVVGVITALEEHYGFEVDDDEINAEVFETVGTLAAFVAEKNTATA